jgi:hypothetical protein
MGGTPLAEAVLRAGVELSGRSEDRKILVVMTDEEPNDRTRRASRSTCCGAPAWSWLLECPRAYPPQYLDRIRPWAPSAHLTFGTAVHEAINGWVAKGFDPVVSFRHGWQRASRQPLSFSSRWDADIMGRTGERLMEQFPGTWKAAGLTALVDEAGTPLAERRFAIRIGGPVFSSQPDFIGYDRQGDLVVLDFKTPSSEPDPAFDDLADQITAYQMILETDPAIGTGGIGKLGFMDLMKRPVPTTGRGKGPEVLSPRLVPARSREVLADYSEKLHRHIRDILGGWFPRRSLMAHNSPCALCDYRRLCARDEMGGLVRDAPGVAF